MTENLLLIADASLIIVNNYDYNNNYLEANINGTVVPFMANLETKAWIHSCGASLVFNNNGFVYLSNTQDTISPANICSLMG